MSMVSWRDSAAYTVATRVESDPSEGAELILALLEHCLSGLESRLPVGEYENKDEFESHLLEARESLIRAIEVVHPRHNPQRGRASSRVQSVLIPTDSFTLRQARKWIDEHGYDDYGVDETEQYYRFRQFDPDKRHGYRTIEFGDSGIKAVIQVPKKPRKR